MTEAQSEMVYAALPIFGQIIEEMGALGQFGDRWKEIAHAVMEDIEFYWESEDWE